MENFATIIRSNAPVLVDFSASWSATSRSMLPVVAKVKKELGVHARVIRLDVGVNRVKARKYHVEAIPTFIIFKKGKAVWRATGQIAPAVLMQQMIAFA